MLACFARLRTRAHLRRDRRRLVYVGVALALALLALGAFLAYRGEVAAQDDDNVLPAAAGDGAALLIGQVASLDVAAHVVAIDWLVAGRGAYADSTGYFLSRDVSVHQSGVAAAVGSYRAAWESDTTRQSITTQHRLKEVDDSRASVSSASAVLYPYDRYFVRLVSLLGRAQYLKSQMQVNASLALVDLTTNATLPVAACAVSAATVQGWRATSVDIAGAPFVGAGFAGKGCVVRLRLARDAVSRVYAVAILAVMAAVAAVTLHLCLRTVFFGRKIVPSVIALPATVAFALPSLRSTLPGAPAFGIYCDVFVWAALSFSQSYRIQCESAGICWRRSWWRSV